MEEVKKTTKKTTKKYTLDVMVMRTINGIYGFGNRRKELIEKDGWNYDKVQAAVNKKLGIG